jgi:hypothetical protein
MYSTCMHCQRDLGRNALIETLPIGRRIAFDEATGRLWVVCPACARWNLVPFDSRWEAIEAGEKLYRASSQRMSTGEIGLAKTREGTELVRVGKPLRPEMAAWRYGAQLVQRRWKYATTVLPLSAAFAFITQPQLIMEALNIRVPLQLMGLPVAMVLVQQVLAKRFAARTRAHLDLRDTSTAVSELTPQTVRLQPAEDGMMHVWLPVVRQPIEQVSLLRQLSGPFAHVASYFRSGGIVTGSIEIDAPTHYTRLEDDQAIRALRVLLPILNQSGATRRNVSRATTLLTDGVPSVHGIVGSDPAYMSDNGHIDMKLLPKSRRLALEMLVHEDSERRWLASDLLDLEAEWRRADEIAAIADGLLRDDAVEHRLRALQQRTVGNTTTPT